MLWLLLLLVYYLYILYPPSYYGAEQTNLNLENFMFLLFLILFFFALPLNNNKQLYVDVSYQYYHTLTKMRGKKLDFNILTHILKTCLGKEKILEKLYLQSNNVTMSRIIHVLVHVLDSYYTVS